MHTDKSSHNVVRPVGEGAAPSSQGSDGMPQFFRRRTLGAALASMTLLTALPQQWLLAAESRSRNIVPTPSQTRGPFYPVDWLGEADADLTRLAGAGAPAQGETTHLSGQVFGTHGGPLSGVRVEIWQCDANGRYRHPDDRGPRAADPGFQGFGATVTDSAGNYSFKTIRPVAYAGRTPHIHFRLSGGGVREFVTQLYIAGHPGNDADGLFRGVRDRRLRDALTAPFRDIKGEGGRIEWTARFDLVVEVSA